jgi:peptidoglycan/LPS O-acetylase OafA/YrhL
MRVHLRLRWYCRGQKTGPQADDARPTLAQHVGMARLPHRFRRRPDDAAPILLPTFFLAMLVLVGAVVVIGQTGSDLAEAGAVALLLLAAALVMVAIGRALREEPPADGEGEPR